MMNHSDCPPFVSCEYATGNCWYIEFEAEDQAQEAFRYLRETVKKFKGDDIKVGVYFSAVVSANKSHRQQD